MNLHRLLSLWTLLALCIPQLQAQVSLDISPSERGAAIGKLHYGIFFEEINHAGDGGLYAELIRNRSFEDNASTEYWSATGGAAISRGTASPLNEAQQGYADVSFAAKGDAVVNSGFWGMNIEAGTDYKLSLFVKTSSKLTLAMRLLDDSNNTIGVTTLTVSAGSAWQKKTATITATGSCKRGQFAIANGAMGAASFSMDVVSLFPPTFKGRENGCRPDLAQKLADMKPAFMRFPGGCYIEGQYADGDQNRFEWKKTIGGIETRPGHRNVNWNYRVSDGLGFHEMLQLSEDLGAEPLFVVNVGLGHGWYQPLDDLDEYIQEALDALEYANGDASTKYGAMRIANGHEAPFNLRLIEIGNENYNFSSTNNSDQSLEYAERYYKFYQAIKAAYPDAVCIGNVQSWGTDSPTWRNSYPVDAVDEHYYRSPAWFVSQYNKYDGYNRATSPKVYAGEYAVTQNFGTTGNLAAALGEAVYMQGMENNSDICIMGSYAPIFVNENDQKWKPDMIRFNASESYGTPSYYVQKLMPNYVGKENVKWTETDNKLNVRANYGGISTWLTAATFANYKVTKADGTTYTAKFDGTENWTNGGGSWTEKGGTLTQSSTSMQGLLYTNEAMELGEYYTIEVDATKTAGAEGFLIAFNYNDSKNYCWWNLGGWGNTQHAVEVCKDGTKTTVASTAGSLVTGQTYHIKIEVAGSSVKCYLDGVLKHSFNLPMERRVYVSSSIDDATGKLYVKIVNPNAEGQNTTLNLKGYHTTGGKMVQMTAATDKAENTTADPYAVVPTEQELAVSGSKMLVTIPAYSFNILELNVAEGEEASNAVAVPEGTYYIYNKEEQAFLGRGAGWGTQATLEKFGIPVAVTTAGNGNYTLRHTDFAEKFIGIDGSIYTDKATSFPINWQFVPTSDSRVKIYNAEENVYIKGNAIDEGCATTDSEAQATAFELLDKTKYAAIIAEYDSLANMTEGTLSVDMSDMLENATMADGVTGWECKGYIGSYTYEAKNRAGVNELYEKCGTLKQTVKGLTPNALYRFKLQGFVRNTNTNICVENAQNGLTLSNAYIYAGNSMHRFADWASERTDDTEPNTMEAAAACFKEGKYMNTVVGRADSEGNLTVGLEMRQRITGSWLIWGAATLELCTEPVDYTSSISNPSFENGMEGWDNNGMQTQNNTEPSAAKTGTYYCERWTKAPGYLPDGYVQQTVTGLKEGTYRVTATCHAENQSGTPATASGVFLFAGEGATEVSATGEYSATGTAINGELTIGFKSEGTNANWMTVDNFRLEWIGEATTGYKKALVQWISRLENLIGTKKILNDEQKQQAQQVITTANAAQTQQELSEAIAAVKAKYEELDAYRIEVDRSTDLYKGYLFAFFPSNSDENLYYAYSEDGFNYTVLNDGQRVMASDTVAIKKGIRDPHILRGEDGKTFYMVATDMRCAEGWASNRGIVLYKSTDLVHWQHSTVHFPTRFPDGWSSVTRVWAPEVIWDANYDNGEGKAKGRYLIYFSLLTSDDGTCNYDKVYYCYANDDFTDLLDYPVHFYDRGSATIDADIVFDEGDQLYHMIYKNEGSGGICHVTAERLTPEPGQPTGSQWSAPTGTVQQTNVAVEGGGIFRLIGENTWVVMYDCYGSGYYQFCTTTDWKTFTLKAQTATSGAFTPRHGTVMPITVKEYNTLIKAFPTSGLTSCNIGDVNGDNILTVADANMMANYYVGTPQTGFNRFVADMNNDLAITIADANEVTNAYLTAE